MSTDFETSVDAMIASFQADKPLADYSTDAIHVQMWKCLDEMENGKLDAGELATYIPDRQLAEFVRTKLDGRISYTSLVDYRNVVQLFGSASACRTLLNQSERPTLHYTHLRTLARYYTPEQRRDAVKLVLVASQEAWSDKQLKRELKKINAEPLHDEYQKLGDLYGCLSGIQYGTGTALITFILEVDGEIPLTLGDNVKIGLYAERKESK